MSFKNRLYLPGFPYTDDTKQLLKNKIMLNIYKAAIFIVFYTLVITPSFGQLSQNLTIGNPKAIALGNAVTADPPGIDSIHFNPAGLIRIKEKTGTIKLTSGFISHDVQFGETYVTDEKKIALCAITEECDVSAGEWQSIWPTDPVANTESKTNKSAMYLPGQGIKTPSITLVPTGGIAITDSENRFTFATAAYSPLASGVSRPEDDTATFHGIESAITRITYFSPSFAFRVNDELSVGLSIGFSYQGTGVSTNFRGAESTFAFMSEFASDVANIDSSLLRFIGPYDSMGRLEMDMDDNFSTNFNIGLLWEPKSWLSFGLVYQSEATSNMKGNWRMDYTSEVGEMISSMVPLNPIFQAVVGSKFTGPSDPKACLSATENGGVSESCEYSQSGELETEFTLPEHIAVGVSVLLLPNIKVNFDIKWTRFSQWDLFEIKFDKDADFLLLADLIYFVKPDDQFDPTASNLIMPRNYEDSLTWALGIEYTYSDNLRLRFGVEPRGGSIPNDKVDLGAPYVNGYLYGLGFGYDMDKQTTIDFGVGWWRSEFKADYGESDNSNSLEPGRLIYNPYATQEYESKADAYIVNLSFTKKL